MAKKRLTIVSLLTLGSMLLAACGGDSTATPVPPPTTPPAAATDTVAAPAPTDTTAPAAPTDTVAAAEPTNTASGSSGGTMDYSKVGQELADAFAGKYKGTKVTMFPPSVIPTKSSSTTR
jgi:hypothetical protein